MQKKSNWFIVLVILTAIKCKNTETSEIDNTQQTNQYQINGIISDSQDGLIYLEEVDTLEGIKAQIDSTIIKDGNFTFEGSIDEPRKFRLKTADSTPSSLYFILSNDQIKVAAVKDSLSKGKIVGATVNDEYQDYYYNYFNKIREEAGPIYQLSDSLTEGGKRELSPTEKSMMDKKWEMMNEFSDSLTKLYVTDHENSLAAPLVITDRYINYPNPDKAEALYNTLSKEVKESFYGQKLAKALEGYSAVAIGRQAPPIKNQIDLEGKQIGLEDYKGNYVLIDFWASWCGPCRKENPNVLKAYNTYHSEGLEILAISLDDKRDLWENAIKKDKLPWKHVSDLKAFKNQAAQDYMVSAIPQNFLINPDGIIIATNLREETLHTKLKEVFSEL